VSGLRSSLYQKSAGGKNYTKTHGSGRITLSILTDDRPLPAALFFRQIVPAPGIKIKVSILITAEGENGYRSI
jgi:hypothetical protein